MERDRKRETEREGEKRGEEILPVSSIANNFTEERGRGREIFALYF